MTPSTQELHCIAQTTAAVGNRLFSCGNEERQTAGGKKLQ